jgi:tripartite-type tricarboxylate transporter receptor subunit TctC
MFTRKLKALRVCSVLAALALSGLAPAARCADFPDRPITIVSPYEAGGPVDLLARLLAKGMGEKLGQAIIVQDKPGAGGAIGANFVAQAAPDGYTLLLATPAALLVTPAMVQVAYHGAQSFSYVGMVDNSFDVLVVNARSPIHDIEELVATAQAKPRSLNYGTAGIGTSPFMDGETFKQEAHIDVQHVPFKGAASALAAVMGDQTQIALSNTSAVLPFIKQGQLRALAYAAPRRSESLPEVPTFAEAGYPGVVSVSWRVLAAPAGTSADVLKKLGDALQAVQSEPEFQDLLKRQGSEVFRLAGPQAAAYVQKDAARTEQVLQTLGLTKDAAGKQAGAK